jgi:zinc D-Ala-D-Ala carboxypeptidase
MPKNLFLILTLFFFLISININSCAKRQSENQKLEDYHLNSPAKINPHPKLPLAIEPSTQTLPVQTKYGHLSYQEGDISQMTVVASYAQGKNQRFEKLVDETTQALMKLIYAARDEGVWIIPVSGFRTIDDQYKLFEKQTQKLGSKEAASKLSAPPNYSEHHTGYAVDLTDGHFPQNDITYKFAETEAFKWLMNNAKKFGFEMSFPQNNPQGISYEPWHWRFIGSPKAVEIFRNTRGSAL